MNRFNVAPLSVPVKVVSALGTLGLLGISIALARAIPYGSKVPFAQTFGTLLVGLPAVILAFAVLLVVRGYRVNGSVLLVERLLWNTRVDLEGLSRAWYDPSAMCRSFRLFGNGGLFSVTGFFHNSSLGRYRAFVTDPKSAVILCRASGVVVVSPAHPQAFLLHLQQAFQDADISAA